MSVHVVPEGTEPEPAPVPTRTEAPPDSIIGRLRARAADAQRARALDLNVPGWQDELVVRFRPLTVAETDRFAAKAQRDDTPATAVSMDLLARACAGVYGRDGDRLVELADADGPVRLEHRLGVLLGMDVPDGAQLTAHEVILWLFGGEGFAIDQFASRVFTWMRDRPTSGEA